jgi:hypothetical protein
MRLLQALVFAPLFILFLPMWPVFWLYCRLAAEECPACGSKWQTELVGEWDGEMWKCHRCTHYWEIKFRKGEPC